MAKIKICGLTREEDALYVNTYKPDFVGFIFAPGRRRTLTIEKAKAISNKIDKAIIKVGVFLDQDIDYVMQVVDEDIIDAIQLHGKEDENYISRLIERTTLPIIKAYSNINGCDYVLYDNIEPGSGETFDWSTMDTTKPFFIAGGINKDNILDALALKPYAVDVSSGVETDGFKDPKKIEEIIRMVRTYEG